MEDSAADITIVYEDIIDCDNDVKIISDEPNTNVRRCKKKRQYIKRQELWVSIKYFRNPNYILIIEATIFTQIIIIIYC